MTTRFVVIALTAGILLALACNMFTPDISGEWEYKGTYYVDGVPHDEPGPTICFLPSKKQGNSQGVFIIKGRATVGGFPLFPGGFKPVRYEVTRDSIIFRNARGSFPITWKMKFGDDRMTATTGPEDRFHYTFHRTKTLTDLESEEDGSVNVKIIK